jgi:ABC-type molybdate transport system substrate-binding protein
MHAPLLHQAILIKDSAAAREFMTFVQTTAAQRIIVQHGYDLPTDDD